MKNLLLLIYKKFQSENHIFNNQKNINLTIKYFKNIKRHDNKIDTIDRWYIRVFIIRLKTRIIAEI